METIIVPVLEPLVPKIYFGPDHRLVIADQAHIKTQDIEGGYEFAHENNIDHRFKLSHKEIYENVEVRRTWRVTRQACRTANNVLKTILAGKTLTALPPAKREEINRERKLIAHFESQNAKNPIPRSGPKFQKWLNEACEQLFPLEKGKGAAFSTTVSTFNRHYARFLEHGRNIQALIPWHKGPGC